MWIAITSKGTKLNVEVDPRFGRCPYFIFYELDTGNFKTQKNPYAISLKGAGIQAAKRIIEEGVEAVLTGNIGPKALRHYRQQESKCIQTFREKFMMLCFNLSVEC